MEGDLQGKASGGWGGTGGNRGVCGSYEHTGWPSIILPLGDLTCSGYIGFIFCALCLECVFAFMLCVHVGEDEHVFLTMLCHQHTRQACDLEVRGTHVCEHGPSQHFLLPSLSQSSLLSFSHPFVFSIIHNSARGRVHA